MAKANFTTTSGISAAAYIRMSWTAAGQVPRRTAGGDHQTGHPRRVLHRRVVHR